MAVEVVRTEPGDGGLAEQSHRKMVLAVVVVVVVVGLRKQVAVVEELDLKGVGVLAGPD